MNLDDADDKSITVAARNHHFEGVRILFQYLADKQPDETKNILQLVLSNDIEFIRTYILNHNYDINQPFLSHYTLLDFSVLLNTQDLVSLLMSQLHADSTASHHTHITSLSLAAVTCSAEMVKTLLRETAAEVNGVLYSRGRLSVSCAYGNVACVKALLAHSAVDVNATDEEIYIPLHSAVSTGHSDCAHTLLDSAGISLNMCNDNRETPLSYALHHCQADSIFYLLKHIYINLFVHCSLLSPCFCQ